MNTVFGSADKREHQCEFNHTYIRTKRANLQGSFYNPTFVSFSAENLTAKSWMEPPALFRRYKQFRHIGRIAPAIFRICTMSARLVSDGMAYMGIVSVPGMAQVIAFTLRASVPRGRPKLID